MRAAIFAFGVLALLLLGSCSGSDKDPITEKCESVCKLDPADACAEREADCVLECRSYGTKAASFGTGPKCGDCVAGSYKYTYDASGACVGFAHKAELTPECRPSCVPPDAGATGI